MITTKKEKVIEVAKLIFAEKGLSRYSLQDILEESNISKGTFYNYFSSKDEFFIEYIKYANKVESQRREVLLEGEQRDDRHVFAKQIHVRIEITREFSLFPIFEMAFHAKDPKLKQLTEDHFINELRWLVLRLMDIYGADARIYAEDCAVLINGMMQSLFHTLKMLAHKKVDSMTIVYYILRQIDGVMKSKMTSDDAFLFEQGISLFNIENKIVSKISVIEQLTSLKARINEQYVEVHEQIAFLIKELENEHVRLFITKPILHALSKRFKNTAFKEDFQYIYNQIVDLLYTSEKEAPQE